MSLGIAPDLRFKLEYYGSKWHVFNELELEGASCGLFPCVHRYCEAARAASHVPASSRSRDGALTRARLLSGAERVEAGSGYFMLCPTDHAAKWQRNGCSQGL